MQPFRLDGGRVIYNPLATYIPVWFCVNHMHYWRDSVRGTVLDCGCGSRPYEELLRGHFRRYIGFDYQGGGTRWGATSDRVDFISSVGDIAVRDGAADTALCLSVLEHVPFDPSLGIREVHRVLSDGGLAFFVVPFTYNTHGGEADFWRWTRYGLAKQMAECGFEVLEVLEFGGPIVRLLEMLVKLYWMGINNLAKLLRTSVSGWRLHNWLVQLPQRLAMAVYAPIFRWTYGYGDSFDGQCPNSGKQTALREAMHPYTMAFLAVGRKTCSAPDPQEGETGMPPLDA